MLLTTFASHKNVLSGYLALESPSSEIRTPGAASCKAEHFPQEAALRRQMFQISFFQLALEALPSGMWISETFHWLFSMSKFTFVGDGKGLGTPIALMSARCGAVWALASSKAGRAAEVALGQQGP